MRISRHADGDSRRWLILLCSEETRCCQTSCQHAIVRQNSQCYWCDSWHEVWMFQRWILFTLRTALSWGLGMAAESGRTAGRQVWCLHRRRHDSNCRRGDPTTYGRAARRAKVGHEPTNVPSTGHHFYGYCWRIRDIVRPIWPCC